jgi:hypothetical protein
MAANINQAPNNLFTTIIASKRETLTKIHELASCHRLLSGFLSSYFEMLISFNAPKPRNPTAYGQRPAKACTSTIAEP